MTSFFDEFTDLGGGGSYMKAAEKDVLIEQGIPFAITAVSDDPDNSFGPRFVAFVLVPDPESGEEEERKISFPRCGVESRDRMLRAMMAYFADKGEEADPVMVKLTKVNKSIIIVNANA